LLIVSVVAIMPGNRRVSAATSIEGYASATSIAQGGTINFHLSGDPDSFVVEVRRKGLSDTLVTTGSGVVAQETRPANAYEIGCNWPVRYQLAIPTAWPSGVYSASFRTNGGGAQTEILFVVRASAPGSASKILYQLAVNTGQAYNNWGGKSLYDFNSTQSIRAASVSFNRPLDPSANFFYQYDYYFLKWLETVGIAVEFCTSIDLHADSTLIGNYQLLLGVGHDEYWSAPMRDHVEAFTRSGGNVAFFGGNTCWWQVRLQPDPTDGTPNRQLVCYKYLGANESGATADPSTDPRLATTHWYDSQYANRPENRMTGLSSRTGAGWAIADPRPAVDFIVRASSWVFAGTGVVNGTGFGASDLIVGYETDAAQFVNGDPPRVLGSDGTAYNFAILATADATAWPTPQTQPGWALLGLFQNNGTVFNVGTTDWSHGLQGVISGQSPNTVARVTENVVRHLSQPRSDFQKATLAVYSYHAVQLSGDGWRFYFSTDPFVASGWQYDGVAFYAHSLQLPNAMPVYQYHVAQSNGDGLRFYFSTDPGVQSGWTLDGVAFYAYPSNASNSSLVPVYQYHVAQSDGGWRFYFSTDPTVTSGWTKDGIAFYAFATNPAP
jgi:hypothetical protein